MEEIALAYIILMNIKFEQSNLFQIDDQYMFQYVVTVVFDVGHIEIDHYFDS